jgi:hypothetical protein
MKIKAERFLDNPGEVVFKITASELQICPVEINCQSDGFGKILEIHQEILRDLNRILFAIEQEIYNETCRVQSVTTQRWINEIAPQGVKYYFDNDKTIESDYEE